jgi:hypothetical protein
MLIILALSERDDLLSELQKYRGQLAKLKSDLMQENMHKTAASSLKAPRDPLLPLFQGRKKNK